MTTNKIKLTLQKIKNDNSLENHFFKKLAVANNPLEWLIPLRDAGYFSPEKNLKPQEVPKKKGYYNVLHWNVLDALENMAVKNEENPEDKVSGMLSAIVDEIIVFRENGEGIGNYRTDWKLLQTISHFPIKYIGVKHIELIKDSLCTGIRTSLLGHEIGKLFLPKLIRERAKELILKLLNVILHYRESDRENAREYVSVLDSYYMKEGLDKNKTGISKICAIEAANVAIKKIQEIIKEDKSCFSNIWIPTIEDHEQTDFPDRYECQLVHFVRDMLEAADPKEIEPIVRDMLGEEHNILKRIAYHLINHHYDVLSPLFWSLCNNPLNSLSIHELYELIKSHCKSFDTIQIDILLNWIEDEIFTFSVGVFGITEKEEKIKAYYKKEWLLALFDTGNDEVRRRYEAHNSVNDATIEHPGFHSWSSGVYSIQDVSPIDEKEFKEKTNDEIAVYINAYKEADGASWREGSTRVDLASSFRTFISNDPERFSKELNPFLSVPRKYQHEFLRGFEEAWRNDKNFDWNELLPFIKTLIEDNSFWSEKKEAGDYDYNRWIGDTIANLIEDGTKNEKHAFSPDLLPIAEQILLILLKNVKTDMGMINDLVTSVLNSSKGRVFMAAINYSLRYARLYCRDKENRWVKSIKSEFSKRLYKTKESSLEFSVVIGQYLIYLNYLDKKWVVDNFNRIFDLENDKYWEAAFVGHIVMTSKVYKEIYKLLRDNGHYEKGLSYPFKDKHVTKKLIQNIAIGYLAGWDDLNDAKGLQNKLLENNNPENISVLIAFVWSFRNKDDEVIKRRIKLLWKIIIEKVVQPNFDNDKYRILASALGKWLSFVEIIDDDIHEWLKLSVEAMDGGFNSSFFIEYLRKHVEKTPDRVGDLYLKMIENGALPTYKEEDIIAIVQTLYELEKKDIANRICNLYSSKGVEFLRETFEKYI